MNAWVDGKEVSLVEAPAFTYSLFDFINPSKTKGNKSTSIRIAADSRARAIFGGPVMAEARRKTYHIKMGDAGLTYWEGTVRVEKWTRNEVECSAVGGNASWMEAAKALRLRDIEAGISEPITAAYQVATWTAQDGPLYFPLIDYGFVGDQPPDTNIPVARLRPAARAWWMVRKGFAQLGFGLVAKGRFEQIAPKLVMPNTADNINATQSELDSRIAVASVPLGLNIFTRTGGPIGSDTFIPEVSVEESDPSNSYNPATYAYSPNVLMSLQPSVSLLIRTEATGPFRPSVRVVGINNANQIINWGAQLTPTSQTGPIDQYEYEDLTLPASSIGVVPTRIALFVTNGQAGDTIQIQQLRVTWTPVQIPYQTGITLDLASTNPDWSLGQLVAELQAVTGCKFITNDSTGLVEAWLYDDLLRPIDQGIDLRGREDHTEPPEKLDEERPSQYLFRYKEDDKDKELERLKGESPSPGYGNADIDIGGLGNPVNISTGFAATAMGLSPDGLLIPIMRDTQLIGGGDQVKRVPRLLIADGVQEVTWRYNGALRGTGPRCYFLFPGLDLSLAFGPEPTTGSLSPGTVARWMGEFVRRIRESYALSIRLRWWDDELIKLDLRRPVMVSDGFHDGWYYVQKIEQKQFGVKAYTKTTLIQA